jgi:transcriptional regulator with XRE-family HTH domain
MASGAKVSAAMNDLDNLPGAGDTSPECALDKIGFVGDLIEERERILSGHQNEKLRKLVGARLRSARILAGMDQIESAQAVGFKAATQLCEAETGKRMFQIEKLVLFARLYDVSLDYLFGVVDDPHDPHESIEARLVKSFLDRYAAAAKELASALAEDHIQAARAAMNEGASHFLRMAQQAVEIELSLLKLRKLNPHLDDEAKGLATLMMKVEAHADMGRKAIQGNIHQRAGL